MDVPVFFFCGYWHRTRNTNISEDYELYDGHFLINFHRYTMKPLRTESSRILMEDMLHSFEMRNYQLQRSCIWIYRYLVCHIMKISIIYFRSLTVFVYHIYGTVNKKCIQLEVYARPEHYLSFTTCIRI